MTTIRLTTESRSRRRKSFRTRCNRRLGHEIYSRYCRNTEPVFLYRTAMKWAARAPSRSRQVLWSCRAVASLRIRALISSDAIFHPFGFRSVHLARQKPERKRILISAPPFQTHLLPHHPGHGVLVFQLQVLGLYTPEHIEQRRDQSSPSGLMACAEPRAVVAMKVFVEKGSDRASADPPG